MVGGGVKPIASVGELFAVLKRLRWAY